MSDNGAGFLHKFLSVTATAFHAANEAINRTIEDAYRKGYAEGAAAMRESILAAAQTPLTVLAELPAAVAAIPPPTIPIAQDKTARAKRGSVGQFVSETLKIHEGLTQQEIKDLAHSEGISSSSIGNELRRKQDVLYRCDERKRWHLINKPTMESTAGTQEGPAVQEVYQSAA